MALRDLFRRSGDIEEAAPKSTPAQPGPANVQRAGFEFGIAPGGINEYTGSIGAATQTDRRSEGAQLYEAYLACPWAWASVQAISKTITAGPLVFDWDQDDGEGDQEEPEKPPEVLACERLFKYTNQREDIRQLMRSTIADLLVFGDAFIEIVWLSGIPVALFSLDSPSMFPDADEHGNIKGYVQVTDFQQRAEFDPHEIIHISMDSPRSGMFGVSPTSAALLPITTWLFAAATLKEIVRKGIPPQIHVDMPPSQSDADRKRWRSEYRVNNIGPRNIGNPLLTKNGAVVTELQQRKMGELLAVLDQKRDEIVATYGAPPAEVGIIESGNLGGGTGESQHRSFLVTTCAPLAAIVLEKLDYHLVQRGFGIVGWYLKFDEVDMRDSAVIETIRDQRIRNGLNTLNRARAEIGEPPVDGGDTAVLVDRTAVIAWRDMDASTKATIASTLVNSGIEMDDPGDEDKPVKLVKPPPPPPPPAPIVMHPGATPGATATPGKAAAPAVSKPTAAVVPVDPAGAKAAAKPAKPTKEDHRTDYQRRLREAMEEMPHAS